MPKSKRPARPTGTITGRRVSQTSDGLPIVMPLEIFKFPSIKEDAELVAVNGLLSQLQYVPYQFTLLGRHPHENGPDFDVTWNDKPAFVEVTELAPLTGPYRGARRVFTVGEMTEILENLIRKKHSIYAARGYRPVFLLIYVTDDAFYVAEEVLLTLAHCLQLGSPLTFEAVFFVSFWSDGRAHLRMPFPDPRNLAMLNIARLRDQQVINPDLTDSRIVSADPSGRTVTIRQYLPKGCDPSKLVESIKAQLQAKR